MFTSPQIWNIFFGGRYILLLMSFFSIYTGCIYNDIFSKSFNIFGSAWHIGPSANATQEKLAVEGEIILDPYYPDIYDKKPYPFGMDPIWQVRRNTEENMRSDWTIQVLFSLNLITLPLY